MVPLSGLLPVRCHFGATPVRVYRRADRSGWFIDLHAGGKRIRLHAPDCRSRKEAEEYGARRLLELRGGGPPDGGFRLEEAAVAYGMAIRGKRARWISEVQRVGSFVQFAGPRTLLVNASRGLVTRWVEGLETRIGPATCRRYKTSVGAFFRWALARGYIDDNPARGAYAPKSPTRKKRALSLPAIAAALEASEPWPALHAAYLLAFYQGLRRSEIVRARVEDIDFQARTFRAAGEKTRCAEQVLPLHDAIAKWARGRSGWLVATLRGTAYAPSSLENLRVEASGRLRQRLPNFHLARHSLATHVIAAGGTLDDVAALLRISPRTAHEHYAWLLPSIRHDVLNRFRLDGRSPGAPPSAPALEPTAT